MDERLTEWIDGEAIPSTKIRKNGHKRCLNKLAHYEDLEEQGLLLKLPCKPEDKLYWISDEDEEFEYEPIEEVEVELFTYNGCSIQIWFADKGEKEFPVLPSVAIGNELFFTKAEAEKALEELEK